MRRIVVAEVPTSGAFWSGVGPVGVVRWRRAGARKIAVAVRVRTPLVRDGAEVLAGRPQDPIGSRGRRRSALELLAPHELVPLKAACDVSLVGSFARPAHPRDAPLLLHVGLGGEVRTVGIGGAEPVIDASTAAVATRDGAPGWLGVRPIALVRDDRPVETDEDEDALHHAPPALRFPWPAPGATLRVRTDQGDLVHACLGFGVAMRVDFDDETAAAAAPRCDGVVVHLATAPSGPEGEGHVDWTFRATVADPSQGGEIERIAFAIVPHHGAAPDLDRFLPHARFAHAIEIRDLEAERHPPPMDDGELLIARYATWDLGPPAPMLPLEEVAQIQVELEREPARRAAVLAAHELDEYEWTLEERALADRLAEASVESATHLDQGEIAPAQSPEVARYAGALEEERARRPVAPPELDRWALVRAELELGDPIAALASTGLDVAGLVATDRALDAHLDADEVARGRFEALLASAREEVRRREAGAAGDDAGGSSS